MNAIPYLLKTSCQWRGINDYTPAMALTDLDRSDMRQKRCRRRVRFPL